MKTKRKLTAVMLVAAVMLMQVTSAAVNLDYSGPIDSFTGEPAGEADLPQNQERVPVSDGVYYDRTERAYIYALGRTADEAISVSVMDGMIVNDAVRIAVPQSMEVQLYCNGNLVENTDLTLIEAPGHYVLEARQGDRYVRVMDFTIVGETTCLVNSYPMPAGFVITDVEMSVKDENGEWVAKTPQWDRSKVSMSENGDYRIQYECARNGLSYSLQTIIDHTPPTLMLENVVNGLAKGPVDISDLEEGCRIGIALNGGKMSYREELTLSGDYEIILQDEAGNLTSYAFTILPYFDTNSWIFFAIVVALIVGVGVYLYIERKRMRVR